MSLIKEPEGIDFLIESQPLTEAEKQEISEYIRLQKVKQKRKGLVTSPKPRTRQKA